MKIITGTATGLTPVVAGDVVTASFDGFDGIRRVNEYNDEVGSAIEVVEARFDT